MEHGGGANSYVHKVLMQATMAMASAHLSDLQKRVALANLVDDRSAKLNRVSLQLFWQQELVHAKRIHVLEDTMVQIDSFRLTRTVLRTPMLSRIQRQSQLAKLFYRRQIDDGWITQAFQLHCRTR